MKRIRVSAKIQWLDKMYGERFSVPSDIKYCPIIVFDDHEDQELWSATITFEKQDAEGDIWIKLTYLSDSAPFELLEKGRTFCLLEGNKKVAKGRIN